MTAVLTRCAHGSPCWVSLTARDLGTMARFYGPLLGWEFVPDPGQRRVRALLAGAPVAEIGVLPRGPGLPAQWTTYFAVDSADEAAQRIRSLCGTVAVGPLRVDGEGRLAIGADPSGAAFGVWEGHLGREAAGGVGAPAWYGLVTSAPEAAAAFYGALFGRPLERSGPEAVARGEDDAVLRAGGRAVAGIVRAAGLYGSPPHWRVHFAVADVEGAARRAVHLGGRVVGRPRASRYGRVVRLRDPEGGRFSVVERS